MDERVIVIDNGSGSCKAGFSSEDAPRVVACSIIGHARFEECCGRGGRHGPWVGTEAQGMRGLLSMRYPMERGIVRDWDGMAAVWQQVMYGLRLESDEEKKVIISEAPLNPKANREKMLEVLFERFDVSAVHVAVAEVLALYSSGITTGVVVGSGDGVTAVVPAVMGFLVPHAMRRIDMGGRDLTDYLMRMLNERGHSFGTSAEREIVREMKEAVGFVAQDFESSLALGEEDAVDYELPDGETVRVGTERFRCSEPLFRPMLLGIDRPGLPELVYESIKACPIDVRRQLFDHIFVTGGCTMFPGMVDRFRDEMRKLAPATVRLSVVAAPERMYSVWIGGSILGSLGREGIWITREAYGQRGLVAFKR